MKFSLPTSIVAAILGLALVSVPVTVQAQPAASAPAAPAKAKARNPVYHGPVTAIDATAGTATVDISTKKAPGTTVDLVIAPTTKIKKDGKTATLADFKVGDVVGGSYTTDAAGKKTAVTFGSAKASAPKAEKAPKAAPAAK